ncbi:MAG: MFS transporter [Rhodospirillaceae bacterium]|jgi:MFS family permease|nr:MFS transporter [Rhodospirillaceae bacterium]
MGLNKSTWCLAIAETIVWAGMYYLFPALLSYWEAYYGWGKTDLAIAFSLALIVSALLAPVAGRLIDQGHGRVLLTACSVLGGLTLALLPLVDDKAQFYGIWLVIGVSMAGCFYEPCFSFVVHTHGDGARKVITRITLVAGFAGTLSFPTTAFLADMFDWRAGVWAFSGMICFIATPLFWIGAAPLGVVRDAAAIVPKPGEAKQGLLGLDLSAALRSPVFWLLAFAFTAITLNHGVLITYFLPLLAERGVAPSFAVLLISLIGPMQVAGRVAMMFCERWLSIQTMCGLSYGCLIVASICLIGAGDNPVLLIVFVCAQGAGIGVNSIARPVVTAAIFGRRHFGGISGAIATNVTIGNALAPTAGALLLIAGGYDAILATVLALIVGGTLGFGLAFVTGKPKSA